MSCIYRFIAQSRWTEQLDEHRRIHMAIAVLKREILQVESEAAVLVHFKQLGELRAISWLPIRGKPHNFVFIFIDAEAEVACQCRIEETKRVRISDLAQRGKVAACADELGRGTPLADAVDRQDTGLLEGRRVERRCRVREMMVGVYDRPLEANSIG